jgi:hypothetical protein
MKTIIKKTKSNRNGVNKKMFPDALHLIFGKNKNYERVKRFKDGGFIAWPEDKLPSVENGDNEVREGRTKGGGYIAFPK